MVVSTFRNESSKPVDGLDQYKLLYDFKLKKHRHIVDILFKAIEILRDKAFHDSTV